jgi:cephalosporin-C deacetylase-like acetyl esterase
MAFDPANNFAEWQMEVGIKLRELVGVMPDQVPPSVRIEWERSYDSFDETRFTFTSEPGADVPCHLLLPKNADGPVPVVICLQGHSTGMHISLGRPSEEYNDGPIEGDRDFAIQAVAEGYAALVMEQRCFGERKQLDEKRGNNRCQHGSLTALLLGRTMIGERCWDVSRAIDVLESFDSVDTSRIGCMGNSGGGTITFFAACLEPRIDVAMPSCYVCTFRDSIGSLHHCADNYIPGVLQYFEMGDLAGLIAPRPLVVVAGRDDPIFPIAAVKETFSKITEIYGACGAPDSCSLIVGEGAHRFYAEPAWPVFRQLSGW